MPVPLLVDQSTVEIRALQRSDDVSNFGCGDPDLDAFLREDGLRLQEKGGIRVYLAYVADELAGYVAVLNDVVVLTTSEIKKLSLRHDDHHAIAAVKLARLAVSESFRQKTKGLGTQLVTFVFHLARAHSTEIGCRLLTVDAYPTAIGFYERLSFVRNKARAADPARTTISMRLDLMSSPAWAG